MPITGETLKQHLLAKSGDEPIDQSGSALRFSHISRRGRELPLGAEEDGRDAQGCFEQVGDEWRVFYFRGGLRDAHRDPPKQALQYARAECESAQVTTPGSAGHRFA